MRPKTFYIPIGILILVICAIGFLSLRSDTPTEPIMIYKVTTPAKVSTTPETAVSTTPETAVSTTPETATSDTTQEEKARLMQRLAEAEAITKEAEAKTKAYKAETKAAEARTKAYRDELKALKAKDAERTENLSRFTEKGKEIIDAFPDVLAITSEKYLAFSESEQEKFLIRSVEYDVAVGELKDIIASMPQWVLDELEERRPGAIDDFLNLPYLSDLLPELSDLHGRL